MTPKRALEIANAHWRREAGPEGIHPVHEVAQAIVTACVEERREVLTEAAEMLDRAGQSAAALGVVLMRAKP